ncbi:right-handed parallel beta-helix repeat-containing protein [Halobellus sp. GM3]|uniref:right-handed parallel beta-helix repeat-containing protein n=1 Tax=Halobellus sp. GM3 TaxID=3458410 RepID=UPI00403D6E20
MACVVVAVAASIAGTAAATESAQSSEITFVESSIATDTTWTPDDGPYRIIQDVEIEPGATLTIEPGTTVQIAERVTLTVSGSLSANGTEARPVTIKRSRGTSSDRRWRAVRYDGTDASRLAIRNTTLEGGVDGIAVSSREGSISIRDSTLRDFESAGVSVDDVTATPRITIEGSAFQGIGGHAVRASPSFGATEGVSLTAYPMSNSPLWNNSFSLDPGVGVSLDTVQLEYPSSASVDRVGPETLRIGIDRNRNGSIDRPFSGLVTDVSAVDGRIQISLSRSVRIPSDGRLTVEYDGVRNPETRGIYPVGVRLLDGGISQLSDGVYASYNVGEVTSPFRSAPTTATRVHRLSVRESTFSDIDGTGVFVAADRVSALRVHGNRIDGTRGSGLAVRAAESDSRFWYNEIAASDAGIQVETRSGAVVNAYGNRIDGGETGIRIRQSGTRIRESARVTLRENAVRGSSGHGIDVTTRTVELGVELSNNTVRRNGRDGIHLSNWIVRGGVIDDNRIGHNGDDGLSIDGSVVTGVRLARNDVARNGGDGVAIRTRAAARDLQIRNNTLTDGGGHGLTVNTDLIVQRLDVGGNRLGNNAGAGLLVSSPITHSGSLAVTDNVVGANAYGVVVRGTVETEIRRNDIVFNTNAFAEPTPLEGVEPGTGIYVAEGDDGAIINQARAEIPLEELVANPSIERLSYARLWDDTVVVLRRDGESRIRAAEASALAIRRVSEAVPTGIAIPKTGAENESVRVVDNDIYGQQRGLAVDISPLISANTTARIVVEPVRTVHAESNYWGSEAGPYHSSILPEGEGDRVLTLHGWADFIPFRTEPSGPRYARPTPRISAPNAAVPDEQVQVSGAKSSGDRHPVDRYHFTVAGAASRAHATPEYTLVMPSDRLRVELAVEDSLGIDSANATAVTIEPREATATPAAATAEQTTAASPPSTPARPGSDPGLLESIASVWGLLGGVFFLSAVALGGYGMALTFRGSDPPVGGMQIQALAAAGILVWIVSGLLWAGPLVTLGLGAALTWGVLTGLAYLLAR